MSFTRRRVSKIWRRLSSICSSPPLPSLSNDGFVINLLTGRHYLSAFNTRFSRAFTLTSELALSPRSSHTQFRYIANLCEVLVLSVYVSAHRMLVTGQWQLRFLWNLFAKRNRSWNLVSVEWKSNSYGLLFQRFYLLHVWQRREEALSECSYLCFMDLTSVSDWFRFADFLMIRISTFPVLHISGFQHFLFLRQPAFDLV